MMRSLHYDAVVVGAGVAGLTAAARIAQAGASVCVLARGVGSTHLAPGTIDVLGYAPERVASPAAALPSFIAARPEHPYAEIGIEGIEAALAWLGDCVAAGPAAGYTYVGDLSRNRLLPTAIGALRPSAMVPVTMAGGDALDAAGVCVVGFDVLRDFHPELCAANLVAGGATARAVRVELDVGRVEPSAVVVARRFDEPAFRAAFAARLAPLLRDDERVALPAVLGQRDPFGAWSDLKRDLGRPVFEIPTLPPSAPGLRLFTALRAEVRRAGGVIAIGAQVVGARREGDRVVALHAHLSGHERVYGAETIVLAHGGLASGAIELGADGVLRETALGLALTGAPAAGDRVFAADVFAPQPLARAGVAIAADGTLRAQGLENVFVAGASLPGADARADGSGDGISLASGHHVAGVAIASLRAGATA